jgi:hypothetical protein
MISSSGCEYLYLNDLLGGVVVPDSVGASSNSSRCASEIVIAFVPPDQRLQLLEHQGLH